MAETKPTKSMLSEIERIPLDGDAVADFSRERQHLALAFSLFREGGQIVALFSSLTKSDTGWPRDEAIVQGHLVRLAKLYKMLLEVINGDRAEIAWVLVRLVSECVINFKFLVQFGSQEVFKSYVHYSLQHERDLRDRINKNVSCRGGALPIERRMLASIERACKSSGVKLDDLPQKRIRFWAGKNTYRKAVAVGLSDAYSGIFGGASGSVHGSWGDLRRHHLIRTKVGLFLPNYDAARFRPQPLYALALITVDCLGAYVDRLDGSELHDLADRLADLHGRLVRANELHEAFLIRRQEADA